MIRPEECPLCWSFSCRCWETRASDSGRLPKGENSRSEVECEASQSGPSDSEGIAHNLFPPKPIDA